jgi:hypothetical protein
MTQGERMVEIEFRLDILEKHEKANSELLFDQGGGIKLRLDRLERAKASNKNILPIVLSIVSVLTSIGMAIIMLIK